MRRHSEINFDGTDKIILLGDAGFNFYLGDQRYQSGHADENFKKKMGKFPFTYYVVRGNHEERPQNMAQNNPDAWEFKFDAQVNGMIYVEKAFPYIRYFDDTPSIYLIGGYRTLIMGGAYSVDKNYRLAKGWSWFKDEQLTQEEMSLVNQLCEITNWTCDLVLTHTCPYCFEPTDLFLSSIDQNTVDKSMERFFGNIEFKLQYRGWCWGHFHEYRDYPRVDSHKQLMLSDDILVELTQFMEEDVPAKL